MAKKVGDSIHITDPKSKKLKGRVTTKGKKVPTPVAQIISTAIPARSSETGAITPSDEDLVDSFVKSDKRIPMGSSKKISPRQRDESENSRGSASSELTDKSEMDVTYQELVETEENFACCGACGEIYEITEAVFNARVINEGFAEYTHPNCDQEMEWALNNLPETCINFTEHPHTVEQTIPNEGGLGSRTITLPCSICYGALASETQGTTAIAEALIRSGIKNVTVWNSGGFNMLVIVGDSEGRNLGVNAECLYFYADAEDEGTLLVVFPDRELDPKNPDSEILPIELIIEAVKNNIYILG